MKLSIRFFLPLFFLLCLSSATYAEDSEGCRSCVKTYDCSRINTTCNGTCKAQLFTEQIDLESCRGNCIVKLEKCLASAKKSCSFYCGSSE